MSKQLSRIAERERSARFLNGLESSELWAKFGISRVVQIDGFDCIGLPVWSSTRPLSASISINSGKGLNTMMARAGTIAESIEFSFAERPAPVQKQRTISQMSRWRDFEVVAPEKWHLAKGAFVTPRSVFDWDVVAPIQHLDKITYLLPSEAIYIADGQTAHLMRFQSSTNGWATGASREDAILQALYEVVERDAWTIWHFMVEQRGIWPHRIDLDGSQRWQWLHETLNRLDEQALKVVLLDISTDTGLPVVWCMLYDLSDRPAGIFAGFGCFGTWAGAISRALLEAIQSRACYIAGARDDLLRRSFLLMKGLNQSRAYVQAMQIPILGLMELEADPGRTAKEELAKTVDLVAERGFTEFYVRDAGQPFENNIFTVVKVVAPCLEQYKCGYWCPTKRLYDFADRYVAK